MTKALRKNIQRCITGSLGRFAAMLLIILLGVAFLTGLKITRPMMISTADAYLQDTNFFDLRLISTIGFDEADLEAVRGTENVAAAEGSVSADFVWRNGDTESVYHAVMLTETLNRPTLTAGALPKNGSECVVDALQFTEDIIGQKIQISDHGDGDNLFAYDEYTVTGLVQSPLYFDLERGTTQLGDGTLDGFVLLLPEGFDSEYFTELYVKGEGSFELYSDAYDEFIETLSDAVEENVTVSLQTRFDDLVAEGESEISDAEEELTKEQTDAEAELADAKQELDDAAADIADGEAELQDAKALLDDSKAQLDEAAEQLQPGYASWESALAYAWDQYYDGKAKLDDAYAETAPLLEESRQTLEEQETVYETNLAAVESGKAELETYRAQYEAGAAQYESGLAEYNTNYAAYESGLAEYEAALEAFNAVKDTLPEDEAAAQEAELDAYKAQLDQTAAALVDAKAELDATAGMLSETKAELDAQQTELDNAELQLSQVRTMLDVGWNDYNDGVAAFDAQYDALDTAYAGIVQFENGINSYYDGLKQYKEGVASLDDGRKEYADGVKEYEDGVAEFNTEIADAKKEIDDARRELEDLESPDLYVLDRTSNTGYVTFENDSMIVSNLSTIFPIFFFLIAALICSTTMTRMVDDERTQIGTLRALGYSRGSIFVKYMLYAGSAAVIGCVIGYFGGGYLFPKVIWTAYGILYQIPGFVLKFDLGLFIISLLVSLLCSAGTTYFACRIEMASTPANLIRPKTPASGKRILLEYITPLWSHLKFLHKVSLRNIFRFKKRMIMMILGIAGCTALVLTAFGLRDSISNVVDYQFDNIQKYDLSVSYEDAITDEKAAAISEEFGSRMGIDASAWMATGDLTGSLATKAVNIIASDDPDLTDIIDLHRDEETVAFPGTGKVVITEKLSKTAGIKIGDTVTLSLSDTEKADLTVSGIAENYVGNYIYMTGDTYSRAFKKEFEAQTLLIRTQESEDAHALAADMMDSDGAVSVSVTSDTRRMISNMMRSLDYVVALVLGCAAALAFIVLINLGNINISERVREIATIKVLGFHSGETGAYVFRENVILSLMGIVLGLPLGVLLHSFVMDQIQVDMVSFMYLIRPSSYGITVLMVLLFTVITDLILRRKIARIDMAESLKSIE